MLPLGTVMLSGITCDCNLVNCFPSSQKSATCPKKFCAIIVYNSSEEPPINPARTPGRDADGCGSISAIKTLFKYFSGCNIVWKGSL